VIVAHARLRQGAGGDQLIVRLINAYREQAGAVGEDVFGAEFEEGGEAFSYESPGAQTTVSEIASQIGDVLAEATFSEPTGNFPALAERSIEAAIAKYASGWKARTLIDHSSQAILDVTAFFQSIDEWMRIRAGLGGTPLVNSVQVFALSPRGAELRLKVFGDPQRLAVAMENHGVVFWTEDGRRWVLATSALANQLRGSRFLRERRADYDGVFSEPRIEPASDRLDQDETAAPKLDQRF
jgi:hypothetical protein